jgi:Rho termination factor, N-terminal domain
MTTTVKRGAGRPAAAEKTNRHAQRTPLPPKAGVVEDAREVIASTSQPYGDMTVAQLRVIARHLLVEGSRSMRRGDLLNAILEAEKAAAKAQTPERVRRAEAKVDAALKPTKTEKAIDDAFATSPAVVTEVNKRLDSKSGAKAEAFVNEAMRLGWEGSAVLAGTADRVTVTVKRGDEAIDIEWIGGVFRGDCYYHHAGRTAIKLRNASAAKQRMAIPPAKANEEAARVTAHKSIRPKAGKAPSATRKLPFTEASLDQEVLDALYGKEITYTNRISGADETDRVPRPTEDVRLADGTPGRKKQGHPPTLSEGPDGRVLNFVGSAGFKTVLLSQINRVR